MSAGAASAARATDAPRVKPWLLVAAATAMLAWGGNHFTPLLLMYRQVDGYSSVEVDLFLAFYILGLVPGFLVGGPLADRYGRKRVMRPGSAPASSAASSSPPAPPPPTGSAPAGWSSASASRWRWSPGPRGSRSSRRSPTNRAPGPRARAAARSR